MTESFSQSCHDTVSWDSIDPFLVQRSRPGSFIFEIGTLFASVIGPRFLAAAESNFAERPGAGRESIEESLKEIAPFINHADFFVGNRHDWKDDGIGPGDEKIIRYLVETFLEMNIQLSGEGPKNVDETGTEIDVMRHLVSIGGPIPNWYFRNLMYGDEVELPYKFHLNPEPQRLDLGGHSPRQLRKLGRKDTTEFEAEPNWFIADESASPATVFGDDAVPEYGDAGDWITDYFTMIKAPNVHPKCDHNRRVLAVAGCHWLGGMGAIDSLTDPDILSQIKERVGDGNFQALGRVVNLDPGGEARRVQLDCIEPI